MSNLSQFSFITYRSCKHLDGKHTVFGKLVGGLDTLANMERVETDNKDRPIEDLYIEKTIVFVDPFTEVDEEVSHFDEFQTSRSLLYRNCSLAYRFTTVALCLLDHCLCNYTYIILFIFALVHYLQLYTPRHVIWSFCAFQLAQLRQEEQAKAREKEASLEQKKKEEPAMRVFTSGVGKFINPGLKKEARKAESAAEPAAGAGAAGPTATKKKKKAAYAFSDFSGW